MIPAIPNPFPIPAAREPRHPALQGADGHSGVRADHLVGQRRAGEHQAHAVALARLPVHQPSEQPDRWAHALEVLVLPQAAADPAIEVLAAQSHSLPRTPAGWVNAGESPIGRSRLVPSKPPLTTFTYTYIQ